MTNFAIRTTDDLFAQIQQIALRIYGSEDWSGLTYGGVNYTIARTFAELSSLILYNMDMRAAENYLDTLRLRSSARRLALLHGYSATERSGATTTLSFTATGDVTIPRGTKVVSSSGVVFTTTEDLILSSAGSLTGTVVGLHSEYKQTTLIAAGEQNEVRSTGLQNVLIDYLRVRVNGYDYTKVVNFADSSSTDRHYMVEFDDDNVVQIVFGDGTYGKRLNTNDSITLDIHYGGGTAGNGIAVGAITTLRSAFTNSSNISTITNTSASSGGAIEESIDSIKSQLQSRNKYLAGLIAKSDAADTIQNYLTWVADATIQKGYTIVNSITVPQATVVAFPEANDVQDMSSAQSSALATFLASRGELGVKWETASAVKAPVEIETETRITNRALESQTELAVKNALNTDSEAPFEFSELAFDKQYNYNDITDAIEAVDNVEYTRLLRLHKTPQVYIHNGATTDDDWASDLELGENAEDGYMEFASVSTTAASSVFYLPFEVDVLSSDSAKSNNVNWLKQSYEYDAYGDLNDSTGPWVRSDGGTGKLDFKQITRVWKTNEWYGSNWNEKYLLYITWVDNSNTARSAWYSIASNTSSTIETSEDADSPISGTAITNLNTADYSQVRVYIVRDMSQGDLVSPDGTVYSISHNTANTIYTDASNPSLPIGVYSHVRFSEAALDLSVASWQSNSDILRISIDTAESLSATGVVLHVYTTAILAQTLKYKNAREVFTLDSDDVTIRFI